MADPFGGLPTAPPASKGADPFAGLPASPQTGGVAKSQGPDPFAGMPSGSQSVSSYGSMPQGVGSKPPANQPQAAPQQDMFTPFMGPYNYQHFNWLTEPQQLINNAGGQLNELGKSWAAAGALANKTLGDYMPSLPTGPQLAKRAGINKDVTVPDYKITDAIAPGMQATIHSMATDETSQFVGPHSFMGKLDKALQQTPGYNPKSGLDLPMVGSMIYQSLIDLPNKTIRPMLHGELDAPIAYGVREPISAATDALAFGLPAAKFLKGTRFGKAALKAARPLNGRVSMAVNRAGQIVGKQADKLSKIKVGNVAPLADWNISRAQQTIYSPLVEAIAKKRPKLRKMRRIILVKWHRMSPAVQAAIPAAMQQTDQAAIDLVKTHPEAQDFIRTVNDYEEAAFGEAQDMGLFGEDTRILARYGPKYMQALKDGKRPPAIQKLVADLEEKGQPLSAATLNNREIIEDVKKFAQEQASPTMKLKGKVVTRTNIREQPKYSPLVSEGESAAHVRRPPGVAEPDKVFDTGAFHRREASTLQPGPGGYTQLTFKQATGNMAHAFITRIEQLEWAMTVYKWSEDFPAAFANLDEAAKRVIAARVERMVNKALKSADISKEIPVMDYLLSSAQGGPASVTSALDHIATKLQGAIDLWDKTSSWQRLASVMPSVFLPLMIAVQQTGAAGVRALSGPKAFVRTIIATVLASNPKLAEAVMPAELLEKSRELKFKWDPKHPLLKGIAKATTGAIHGMHNWQNQSTAFSNYWRTVNVMSHLLEEFDKLPPEAQKFVVVGLRKQANLERTARALVRTRRALEGGINVNVKHAAQPIRSALNRIARRKAYQNKRLRELRASLATAQSSTRRAGTNAEAIRKLQEGIARTELKIKGLNEAAKKLTQGKRPIYKRRIGTKGKFLTHYLETKTIGTGGLVSGEAQRIMDDLHHYTDWLNGKYHRDYNTFEQALRGTYLWYSMMVHAFTLQAAMHTRFAVTGAIVDRLAGQIRAEQLRQAKINNLSALTTSLGGWLSDKQGPDGTRLVYYPTDWLLFTEGLKVPNWTLHQIFPGIPGKVDDDLDLNWLVRACMIWGGRIPGHDYNMRNPDYQSDFHDNQFDPRHMATAANPTVANDVAASPFPSFSARIIQSGIEGFSEKAWAEGKVIDRLITGHEPGDIMGTHKHILSHDPFSPPQPAKPMTLTGLFPGHLFQPGTERFSSQAERQETKETIELQRLAAEAKAALDNKTK